MRSRKKILICGASIAGPALAFWLDSDRYDVTLVERASKLRTGGQNIDIRDAGLQVVALMGLTDAVKKAHTGEQGVRFVDADGKITAEFPVSGRGSLTAEFEILRGDLARILYEATKAKATYRFGVYVTNIDDSPDGVTVTLSNGEVATYDHVIAADGLGSPTRRLIIGDAFRYRYLGIYTSYFAVNKITADGDWAQWYAAKGGKAILLRPGRDGRQSASVNFKAKLQPDAATGADNGSQKAKVRRVLSGSGWVCDEVSDELLADDDFYLGPVSQVHAERWSEGRCALVGDAAYCPSPLTGMGTSLALVGAYILGNELSKAEDYEAAFKRYEATLRPYVTENQHVSSWMVRLAYPRTQLGVRGVNTLAHVMASGPAQRLLALLPKREERSSHSFQLPRYEAGAHT